MILVQEVLWGVMLWSYVPFVALGIVAAALTVKMPIEVRSETLFGLLTLTRGNYRRP